MKEAARNGVRLILLAALVLGIVLVWRHGAPPDPRVLGQEIGRQRLAPLVFVLVQVLAGLVFVPRGILVVAAGLVWGEWYGALWAMVGGMVAAAVGFLVARYLNGGWLRPEALPRFGTLVERVSRGGWRAVALIRLVPVMHATVVNYALGLTRVPFGQYLVGTLFGTLPMTLFYVAIGAAGGTLLHNGAGWITPTLIGAAALAVSIAVPRWALRRKAASPDRA